MLRIRQRIADHPQHNVMCGRDHSFQIGEPFMGSRINNAALLILLVGCLGILGGCIASDDETTKNEPSPNPVDEPEPVEEVEMSRPAFLRVPVAGYLGEGVEIPTPSPVPLDGELVGTKSNVGEGLRVLVDSIHAHNFLGNGLTPDEYDYHKLHGPSRAINYLRSRDVAVDEVREGRITSELLTGYDMLFLNLPSAEMPPFYFSEIAAIRNFIESGSGMFVFVDHSNAYFHSYRLAPLFEQLELETYLDTACDEPPHTLGTGNAWISITDFRSHPVTEGVECIGIQTGGPVDFPSAVAFTSEKSWHDRWNCGPYLANFNVSENKYDAGYYGNFTLDEDEKSGPMGVVAAKELGEGRIVVVGDQNIFGDIFINYADNYKLWLNSAAWLLNRPALREPQPYIRWRPTRIMLYERYTEAAFGTTDLNGFYHAGSLIGRHYWTFAGDNLDDPYDLLIFGHNHYTLSEDELAAIVDQMHAGKNVLILQSTVEEAGYNTGVIFQLFGALSETTPQTTQKGRAMVIFTASPDHGDVYVLGTDYSKLDSSMLPPAELAPSNFEKPMCDNLLEDVRIALGIAE
jgi:hypothetical protein